MLLHERTANLKQSRNGMVKVSLRSDTYPQYTLEDFIRHKGGPSFNNMKQRGVDVADVVRASVLVV